MRRIESINDLLKFIDERIKLGKTQKSRTALKLGWYTTVYGAEAIRVSRKAHFPADPTARTETPDAQRDFVDLCAICHQISEDKDQHLAEWPLIRNVHNALRARMIRKRIKIDAPLPPEIVTAIRKYAGKIYTLCTHN
jgi:hypothetical protein